MSHAVLVTFSNLTFKAMTLMIKYKAKTENNIRLPTTNELFSVMETNRHSLQHQCFALIIGMTLNGPVIGEMKASK